VIVGGADRLPIGERTVRACNDHNSVTHHHVPMLVLREATAGEFVQQCHAHDISQERIDRALGDMIYFYDVSVD
jgi:hypothetical protein